MAVYQDKDKKGNILKTKDGRSWYFRVYITDKTGNRKQQKSKKYNKKSDAIEAEREFLNQIHNNQDIIKNIYFKDVFMEWLNYKKNQTKITTYYGIEKRTTKHIFSQFSEYKLHSINSSSLKTWIINLSKLDHKVHYKNSIIGYFREILKYAEINYQFDSRLIKEVYFLRDDTIKENINNSKWNFWTFEEFNKFINNVDDPLYNLIFKFLYYMGTRKGEMMGLNWNNIDLINNKVTINRSLTEKVGNGTYIITTTKTKNSNRIIDIPDSLVNDLKRHFEEESKIYNFDKSMFVFGNVNHISSTSLKRKLDFYCNKANVKRITPHGFRHSHVSLLIDLGCDSRDVAERIGDTVPIVESTYYHMFPDKKSITLNKLNNLNFKS